MQNTEVLKIKMFNYPKNRVYKYKKGVKIIIIKSQGRATIV